MRDDRGDGSGKLRGIDQTGRGRAPLVRHIYDLPVLREHYDAADVLTGEIMQSDAETYGSQVAAGFETAIATLKTLAHTLKER